jgi:signal transduction histidine kinase
VSAHAWQQRFEAAQETIRALQDELAETNRSLRPLTIELARQVKDLTAELHEAHEELERTNSELLQLTLELDGRVAARTAELQAKNEEVRAMSQQLWQAAKLATMGELAASIAHELNNPLATVSLRVELLLGGMAPDAPQRRALEVVEQEVERMGQLVANLLQFTRRGQQQVSTMDVREEIERTLELIHYHLRHRQIAVVRQFAPDVPMVQADRQQLRQLFLNLFTNASDAMPQGGTLTLQVKTVPPGQQLEIAISDTGMGIAAKDLPRVMEPFFTTKPEGRGTGLGLPICRRIVQEHQGHLNIVSTVHQGTTVFITLPTQHGGHGASFSEA